MTNCGIINAYVKSELLDKLKTFESFTSLTTNWLTDNEIYDLTSITKLDDIYNKLIKLILLTNREHANDKQKQQYSIGPLIHKLNKFIETHIFKEPPTNIFKCKIRYLNALTFLTCFKLISYMLYNRKTKPSFLLEMRHLMKLRYETLASLKHIASPAPNVAAVLAEAVRNYNTASVLQQIPPVASPIPLPAATVPTPIKVDIKNPFTIPIPTPAAPIEVTPPNDVQGVQTDITKLLAKGEQTDIENFSFSTQSLNLLNKGKFKDLANNNLYFNIEFTRHKLTPKAGPYYNRTYAEYAELLKAMLVTGRSGLKTLQYPATMPVSNAGKMVTSVIADMNHDFKYIEPRLNAINTATVSSFFTSNKAAAVNQVLKKTKKQHKTEFEDYKKTHNYTATQETIKHLETAIDKARKENIKSNNVATAQDLQNAKDYFERFLNKLIEEAMYEEEKKFYQKKKARVLSNQDLYRKAGQQLWETEAPITDAARIAGGRTRKRR